MCVKHVFQLDVWQFNDGAAHPDKFQWWALRRVGNGSTTHIDTTLTHTPTLHLNFD